MKTTSMPALYRIEAGQEGYTPGEAITRDMQMVWGQLNDLFEEKIMTTWSEQGDFDPYFLQEIIRSEIPTLSQEDLKLWYQPEPGKTPLDIMQDIVGENTTAKVFLIENGLRFMGRNPYTKILQNGSIRYLLLNKEKADEENGLLNALSFLYAYNPTPMDFQTASGLKVSTVLEMLLFSAEEKDKLEELKRAYIALEESIGVNRAPQFMEWMIGFYTNRPADGQVLEIDSPVVQYADTDEVVLDLESLDGPILLIPTRYREWSKGRDSTLRVAISQAFESEGTKEIYSTLVQTRHLYQLFNRELHDAAR